MLKGAMKALAFSRPAVRLGSRRLAAVTCAWPLPGGPNRSRRQSG